MKTVCVYHSIDLDGWMSAAIVKYWFNTIRINETRKIVNSDGSLNEETIDFIGYNYGQPIPDLSEYDKVIMIDVSFPKEEMKKIYFDRRDNKTGKSNFIWIDHHISAIEDNTEINTKKVEYKGLQDTNFAACELTWKYFFPNETMPEIVRLLGRYYCFGHKGTDEEQKVLEFQYGARQVIHDYETAYNWLCATEGFSERVVNETLQEIFDKGKAIYKYLCTEAKQVYNNGFEINFFEHQSTIPDNGSYDSILRKFICINKERLNPINFGIDYHKDGYDGCACFDRTADGRWSFSLYNDNGEVDCSAIAKQFGGGGHKGDAEFVINDLTLIFK